MTIDLTLSELLCIAERIDEQLKTADRHFVERRNEDAQRECRKRAIRQINHLITNNVEDSNRNYLIGYIQWMNGGRTLDWLSNLKFIRESNPNWKSITWAKLKEEVKSFNKVYSKEANRREVILIKEKKNDYEILNTFGNLPENREEKEQEARFKSISEIAWCWGRSDSINGIQNQSQAVVNKETEDKTISNVVEKDRKFTKSDAVRAVLLLAKAISKKNFYPVSTSRKDKVGSYRWAEAWNTVEQRMTVPKCILVHFPDRSSFRDNARGMLKRVFSEKEWKEFSLALEIDHLLENCG